MTNTLTDNARVLLAALKEVEAYMTNCGYFAPRPDLALRVRSAIAKAEGRKAQTGTQGK